MKSFKLTLAALFLFSSQAAYAQDVNYELVKSLFKPLPEVADSTTNPVTAEKVSLGKKLYLDPKLSISGTISCNSCHGLKSDGVDNKPTSPGHDGKLGGRNSPTVYNAALHIAQFWDGRAPDVEAQALGPVLNPVEMGMPSEKAVVAYLETSADYKQAFTKAFANEKQPISFKNMGNAIGAFERTLLTPSPFDAYLKGDQNALTPAQKRGLKTFMDTGCMSCHNGVAVGGGMYQKLGVVKPYETKDLGRYEVTKQEGDKFVFKVPSLRNITDTAPYFHDGSVATLEQAVKLMGTHQLGRDLSDDAVADLVSFLGSLSGTHPEMK
jgi:cytochrome c peroxidase